MYSAWAFKRRLTYELVTGGIILLIFGSLAYAALYKPPSCFDGKQNQDERGVDCSGTCSLRCTFEVQNLQTIWTRPFLVSHGFYNALAYVENPNLDSYTTELPFRVQLYDAGNVAIIERRGTVDITGEPIVPVFVGGMQTGDRVPVRAVFEWERDPKWYRMDWHYDTSIEQPRFIPSPTVQKIQANVRNGEVYPLEDVQVTAIVYGLDGNAIATSQTLLSMVPPQETARATFTWPQPLTGEVARIELLSHVPRQR